MPYFKHISYLALSFIVLCGLIGCSDDATQKTPESEGQTTAPSGQSPAPEKTKPTFPLVYVEELDQYQEFYKDQHTTSFSHVPSKNWFSFTAGKDGVLTKILLYGKANVVPNEYYGLSMSGFIREGNPLTGAKFGAWKLSRDDILNQLAAQSLTERDSGWITIRIRGEVPQEAGQTYFFVCDRIPEKSWFGEFAFGEGNPYKAGRNWLNSEHDLVFRTYVGKTKEHIEQTQMIRKLKELEDLKKNQSAPANAPPPSPHPRTPRPPHPSGPAIRQCNASHPGCFACKQRLPPASTGTILIPAGRQHFTQRSVCKPRKHPSGAPNPSGTKLQPFKPS